MLTSIFLVVLYLAPIVGIALFILTIGAAGYLGYLEVRDWARARALGRTRAASAELSAG